MNLNFEIAPFNELSLSDFHDIISLRMQVFAVEQKAAYNDLDGLDKNAFHLVGKNENGVVMSTARILAPNTRYTEASFGRLVVHADFRKRGIGHLTLKMVLNFMSEQFPNSPIKIQAMKYLEDFYIKYGFKTVSKVYLDCGIEHIDMVAQPLKQEIELEQPLSSNN